MFRVLSRDMIGSPFVLNGRKCSSKRTSLDPAHPPPRKKKKDCGNETTTSHSFERTSHAFWILRLSKAAKTARALVDQQQKLL